MSDDDLRSALRAAAPDGVDIEPMAQMLEHWGLTIDDVTIITPGAGYLDGKHPNDPNAWDDY